MENEKMVTCCMCGKQIKERWSCNAAPLFTEDMRCCGDCNERYVHPTRQLIGYEPKSETDKKNIRKIRECAYLKLDFPFQLFRTDEEPDSDNESMSRFKNMTVELLEKVKTKEQAEFIFYFLFNYLNN